MQPPWRFTTLLELLDQWRRTGEGPPWFNVLYQWQTLVAGLVALLAAWITVRESKRLERRKEQREADAIRVSLAVEIQQFIDTMLRTRLMIQEQMSEPTFTLSDLRTLFTNFSQPVVYPAMADRIGLLGSPLAKNVSTFYADVERIKFTAKIDADNPADQISFVVHLIEETCRATLPLVDALALDEAVNIKARVQEMAKPNRLDTTS
jgi:hypothetical protein